MLLFPKDAFALTFVIGGIAALYDGAKKEGRAPPTEGAATDADWGVAFCGKGNTECDW